MKWWLVNQDGRGIVRSRSRVRPRAAEHCEHCVPPNSMSTTRNSDRRGTHPHAAGFARVGAIIADIAGFRANRRPSDDLCLLGIAREVA